MSSVLQGIKTQMELRKSNFKIGTLREENVYESCSQHDLVSAIAGGQGQKSASIAEKEKIQAAMQKGNFMIGDERNRTMKGIETSYKPAVAVLSQGAPESKMGHLTTSVTLGSHVQNYVSETKQMFDEKTGVRDNMIQQMIMKNRSPNFKFDEEHRSKEMTSVMRQQFDYKGTEGRVSLDPAIKADLRQHHFNYGSHPTEY